MSTVIDQVRAKYIFLYEQKYGRVDSAFDSKVRFISYDELSARDWGDRKVYLISRNNAPDLFGVGFTSEEEAEEAYLAIAPLEGYLGIEDLNTPTLDADDLRLDRTYVRDARGRFAKVGSTGSKEHPQKKVVEVPDRITSKTNIAQLKAIAEKHNIKIPKAAHKRASWHEAIKAHEEGAQYFEKKPRGKKTKPSPAVQKTSAVPSDLTRVQTSRVKKLVDDGDIKPATGLFDEGEAIASGHAIDKELEKRRKISDTTGQHDLDDVHAALYRATYPRRIRDGYKLSSYEMGEQLLWYKDAESGKWIKDNSPIGTITPELNEHVRNALGYNISQSLKQYTPSELAEVVKSKDGETLRKFLDIKGSDRPPLIKPEVKKPKEESRSQKSTPEYLASLQVKAIKEGNQTSTRDLNNAALKAGIDPEKIDNARVTAYQSSAFKDNLEAGYSMYVPQKEAKALTDAHVKHLSEGTQESSRGLFNALVKAKIDLDDSDEIFESAVNHRDFEGLLAKKIAEQLK